MHHETRATLHMYVLDVFGSFSLSTCTTTTTIVTTATSFTAAKLSTMAKDPRSSPHKSSALSPTRSQMDTQYVNMLLAVDDIPRMDHFLAKFFTWILLAGFVLFPGTFSSIQNVPASRLNDTEERLLRSVKNLPLFIIAWICCGIGATGMAWLWFKWWNNYIWVVNNIFMPGLLNSFAGIISTLSSVYGAQNHQFSSTSKSTIVVTGCAALICGVLTLIYNNWLLATVKRRHDREVGRERAGKHGEGIDPEAKGRVEGSSDGLMKKASV